MKKYAIIVAGGIGARMKSDVPKQFLSVNGAPIIVHSIRKFLSYDPHLDIITVLPEQQRDLWLEIKAQYFPTQSIISTQGGASRSDSVRAGLALIEEAGLVAVHDAVRPYVSVETIAASFQSAELYGSGVAVVALKDSIRELRGESSTAQDRANYVLVQTPQTFRVSELKNAYRKVGTNVFTDDASVFEAAGYIVHLVDGTYDNVKITTPEDLR